MGVLAQHQAARVEHDQLGAALGGLLEPGGRDRVDHRGVAAGEEDRSAAACMKEEPGRPCAQADALHRRSDPTGISQVPIDRGVDPADACSRTTKYSSFGLRFKYGRPPGYMGINGQPLTNGKVDLVARRAEIGAAGLVGLRRIPPLGAPMLGSTKSIGSPW